MKIMVRAPNPGGRGRAITILQNQNLIVGGQPVDGLRVDEIGEIMLSPAVVSNGVLISEPVYDDAYHANLWIVEP
jgi:hypothetical protein